MKTETKLLPHGDCAVDAVFENSISPEVNAHVLALARAVREAEKPGIVGLTPAYRTLTVEYDPMELTYGQVCLFLRGLLEQPERRAEGKLVRIPVLYGGDRGPDLPEVALHAGMTEEEVVRRHTAPEYPVYMIGFMPGFPYLGGLDPAIACPRRSVPRSRVEGGSVGIAGMQTGVYPSPSPGGWNIIGRTPFTLFDEKTLSLLSAGDRVRFVPIDEETYMEIKKTGEWDG
ncbi:MAG: 5-oxoprolinase subunit PxpB [Clostridia bacterium]|nr:5-oxoprolinase subunit PxpB [Clostridia bacterium]MBR6006449.1 5-oxoprolinase subunit PxpB [Clostridia bacterium]